MPELVNPTRSHGLVDILDRVLDKGLVIAGDIKINLANVELLTIQIRLLVCSIDKAEQIGLNWWRNDPRLTASGPGAGTVSEISADANKGSSIGDIDGDSAFETASQSSICIDPSGRSAMIWTVQPDSPDILIRTSR